MAGIPHASCCWHGLTYAGEADGSFHSSQTVWVRSKGRTLPV